MATTFFKIASATVGSGGASSIDFTSIPQTYTDLVFVVFGKNTVMFFTFFVWKSLGFIIAK